MKYTIEKAKKIAAERGYCILADVWTSKKTKMPCLCVCGEKYEVSLSSIREGRKCTSCRYEGRPGGSRKLKRTTETVAAYFVEQGCELLDEYRGCQTPMLYRCICGNISKIRWDKFLFGHRCGCVRNQTTITLEEARKVYADNGCELLAAEYVPGKMPFRCKCGRISACSYIVMKRQKPHCQECGKEKNRGENSPNYIKDREGLAYRNKFKKRCYKLIEHTLNMFGKKKEGHTYELLGYSPIQLQKHIENHPHWISVKDKKWHLDHIFPIKAFVDHDIYDIKLINALDNLQPMTCCENSVKHDKYNKVVFKEWLATKGFII